MCLVVNHRPMARAGRVMHWSEPLYTRTREGEFVYHSEGQRSEELKGGTSRSRCSRCGLMTTQRIR